MQPPSVQTVFALAKIQPPRPRAGLVERPTLERALGEALQRSRLTLLVAPAGYGKTAALTRQLRRLPDGCALAWVSADEDDQLQRFLACLTAALDPLDLPWRVAPDALATLALAERGLRDVASELVNALASGEVARGLIVIDDAHRIADPQVFELLQLVLDRLPAQWAVVIASRVEPPLSLARWRGAGELAEFRQHELRFDATEIVALLAQARGADDALTATRDAGEPRDAGGARGSDAATARALYARTGGWAAGLRLSLSVAGQGASAATPRAATLTQRHLFDYLAAEVLDDMPAELRDFLLRCSVLPELTATRCAEVSGRADAARLLEQVERRGLFVSVLDAAELTLRLHDLFRDFLEDRLQREHPDALAPLLLRAAAGEPDLVRAVGYRVRAGAFAEAARALAENGMALISSGGGPTVERLLAMLPPAELERWPELALLKGAHAFLEFDFDVTVEWMSRAHRGFAQAGRTVEAATAEAQTAVGMLSAGRLADAIEAVDRLRTLPLNPTTRAFVYFGSTWCHYANLQAESVAPMFAQMIDALERTPDLAVWNPCFFHSLLVGLPGMAPLIERFDRAALRLCADAPSHLRAGVHHAQVWLALDAGRLDLARTALLDADADCRWLGMPRSVSTENYMANLYVQALCGDAAASRAAAQACQAQLVQTASMANRLTHEYNLRSSYLRAAWLLGDVDWMRAELAALHAVENRYEWPFARVDRDLSAALLAFAEGRLEAASAGLAVHAFDIERSCFFPAAQALVLLADAQARLGDADAAAATLRHWLPDAHRGGRLGGALLAGGAVLDRLAAFDWGPRLAPRDVALLARLAAMLRDARRGHVAPPVTAEVAPPDDDARVGVPARSARPMPDGERSAQRPVPSPGSTANGAALRADHAALATLTEREREVLERMVAGDSNKLIARAFDLSPHTVKRHVANILGKLGVDSRGQAAARWHAQGDA